MQITGPTFSASATVDRVLRTLPRWFGIESSLVEYVGDAKRFPTFVAHENGAEIGFLTARQHFADSWEVHCLGVEASCRGKGVGRALHWHVEQWLKAQGAVFLQVKTMAEPCPCPEYAETRAFYTAIGFTPLEVLPELWGPRLPVLLLVKKLDAVAP